MNRDSGAEILELLRRQLRTIVTNCLVDRHPGGRRLPVPLIPRRVCGFSADDGAHHAGFQDFLRRYLSQIAIQYDKVGEHSRRQFAFGVFGELRISRPSGIGGKGLFDGHFLFGVILLCSPSFFLVTAA